MTKITIDLEAVQVEIAQTELRLAELRSFEQMARRFATANNGVSVTTTTTAEPAEIVRLSPGEVEGKIVGEAAGVVLRKHGRPLRTVDIIAALEAVGYGSRLASLKNALFSAMDRNRDTFTKVSRGVWGLTEWENQESDEQETETAQ